MSRDNNAADRPTKLNSTLEDVSLASSWQKGPQYLYLPQEKWPINRDFATRKEESVIPSNEILKKYRGMVQEIDVHIELGVHNLINPDSTNDWNKLIRRIQILL